MKKALSDSKSNLKKLMRSPDLYDPAGQDEAEEVSIEQLYNAAMSGDKEAAAKAFRMFRSKEYKDNNKAAEMRKIMRNK